MRKYITTTGLLTMLVILLSTISGPKVFAATTDSNHSLRSPQAFKHACAQAVRGYASCLALISQNPVSAPATSRSGINPNANPTGGTAPYAPNNLHNAYNLPYNAPSIQTVAIVDAYDDPNAESDMAYYRSTFGIPSCTTSNGCFRKVNQNGGTSYPRGDTGWAQEISLDLDMVSAICYNCNIILVEANSSSLNDLGTAVNTAVNLGATEISNSYGTSGEIGSESAYCNNYYNHSGVAVTASTGDSGLSVNFPAVCFHVVAVGGTTLNSDGSETAWTSAGGGCSTQISQPSWEDSTLTGCNNRADADVSAVADPNTGVYVYDTYGAYGWYQFGGTSVSSPIIASVYALAGGTAGVTDPASLPWSLNSYGCLFTVGGQSYSYQGGLGSPNGTGCF